MVKQADAIKTHTTGGMSDHSTGGPWSSEYGHNSSGAVYVSGGIKGEKGGANGSGDAMYLNVQHTHTYSGAVETRPQNYTVRIWKRTA